MFCIFSRGNFEKTGFTVPIGFLFTKKEAVAVLGVAEGDFDKLVEQESLPSAEPLRDENLNLWLGSQDQPGQDEDLWWLSDLILFVNRVQTREGLQAFLN